MKKTLTTLALSMALSSTLYAVDCDQTYKVQSFAQRFYTEVLGRDADNAGLDDWTNKLTSGKSTGADVATGFVFSGEYIAKNTTDADFVNTLYSAFFGRAADTGGFDAWIAKINAGMSREDVLNGFLYSSEFANLASEYGIKAYDGASFSNPSLTSFVQRFYSVVLGRDADTAGLNDWTNKLSTGTATGADIAFGFVFSAEYDEASKDNTTFLNTLYQAFFNREADEGGFNGWMTELNAGMSREDVLSNFLHSEEFINLTNSFGILAYQGAPIADNSDNVAPVANAGENVNAKLGDTITLDGSASSDSDGSIVCAWWKSKDVMLGKQLSIKTFELPEGEHTVRLSVVDDKGAVASAAHAYIVTPNTALTPTTLQDVVNFVKPTEVISKESVSGEKTLSVSADMVAGMKQGDIFYVPAGYDDRFPFGTAGKIEDISVINADETELVLSEAHFADVVKKSKKVETSVPLNEENFIGVIAPSIVTANSAKIASYKANAVIAKSFLNGGVSFVKTKVLRKSFLGDDEQVTQDSIKLALAINIWDDVLDAQNREPYGGKSELKVELTGELANLVIKESHDIDLVNTDLDPYVKINVNIKGDFTAKLALTGGAKVTLGTYNNVWNEVQQAAFDKWGINAKLTGLSSDDKVGKFPVVGLLFKSPTPVTYAGVAQTPVRLAKSGGFIVWVYANLKGELSLSGEAGVAVQSRFEMGLNKPKDGDYTTISNVNPIPGKRLIKAPYIDGKVELSTSIGVSLEADFFTAGVRLANAGIEIGANYTQTFTTDGGEASWGVDRLGASWSWQGTRMCTEGKGGAGLVAYTSAQMGAKGQVWNIKDIDVSLNFTDQLPSKQDIDNASSGWVGSWYVFSTDKYCVLNDIPVASDESIYTAQDSSVDVTLTGTDGDSDPLTYTVFSGPLHGTLTGTAPDVIYTPDSAYVGSDSFTFQVNDGFEDSTLGTVYISVGVSPTPTPTPNPSPTPTPTPTPSTITHNGTTYGTVTSPYTGKVWLDRNLGAAQVCTSFNDTACYGDYYQWGRNFDGHQDSGSTTTSVLATNVNNVGHGDFIATAVEWASVDSNGTIRSVNWSKIDGTSVCPIGFRVPTSIELRAELLYGSMRIKNRDDAFNMFLHLPSSGFRNNYNGVMRNIDTQGGIWSSSFYERKGSGVYAYYDVSSAEEHAVYGTVMGYPVRCIRD